MITEVDLLEFGFIKNSETAEATGYEYDWYYYTLYMGDICLISSANDELNESSSWTVRLFDYNSIMITDNHKLGNLIQAIKQVII
jgi:hypothetical protein